MTAIAILVVVIYIAIQVTKIVEAMHLACVPFLGGCI